VKNNLTYAVVQKELPWGSEKKEGG